MKKIFLCPAIVLLAAGCSKDPQSVEPSTNSSQLAIEVGIQTRSIVNGTEFANGSNIGVHVAPGTADDETGNKGAAGTPYAEGYSTNVEFTLTDGAWTTATDFNLNSTKGTVYAYYPYDSSVTEFTPSALTIPVALTAEGTIGVKNGSSAVDGVNDPGAITQPVAVETDYMFYDPSTLSTPAPRAIVYNQKAGAQLTMKHALAKVSFRVYKNGSYSTPATLTKFVLADNQPDGNILVTDGTAITMNITDGTIAQTAPVTGTFTRNILGYNLGEVETTATVLSCLVLPVPTFAANSLKATFTINDNEYVAVLPVNKISFWHAGSNYLYTIVLNGTELAVTSVDIVDWNQLDGGSVDIK